MTANLDDNTDTPRLLIGCYFFRGMVLEGVGTFVLGLVEGMVARGWRVTLVLPEGSPVPPDWAARGIRTVAYPTGLTGLTRYAHTIRDLSDEHDEVLLIENNPNAVFVFDLAGRLARDMRKVWYYFYTPLLDMSALPRFGWRRQGWCHTGAKWVGWARLRRFHDLQFVVASQFQKSQLVRLSTRHVAVVPGSTIAAGEAGEAAAETMRAARERARRALGLPGECLVGYLGHYSPAKGVEYLIDAFELLHDRADVKLVIAHSGKGRLPRRRQALLDGFVRAGRAKILSIVDPAQFLAACSVAVLPYPVRSNHHPPLVLVESLAAGTPVITTRVGGIPEAIEDGRTGFVIPPRSPAHIARRVRALADDPEMALEMALAAKASFEAELSRDVFCRRLEAVFRGEM